MLGSPGARKMPAGKYSELTPLRQRGGAGNPVPYPRGITESCVLADKKVERILEV